MEVHSIETIVRMLNDAKVKYLIVGGLAVNAHGFVRLTRDVGRSWVWSRPTPRAGWNHCCKRVGGWPSPKSRRPLPTRRRANAGGSKKHDRAEVVER